MPIVPEQSVPVPVPSLASVLFWMEAASALPLARDDVEVASAIAPAMLLPATIARDLAQARGMADVDPAEAWAHFEYLRSRAIEQGVPMAQALPDPRAQLRTDLEFVERSAGEQAFVDADVLAHNLQLLRDHWCTFLDTVAAKLAEGFRPVEAMLPFVDIDGDDFESLAGVEHMLAWLSEHPYARLRCWIESGLRQQDPGCKVDSIVCHGEPLVLTGVSKETNAVTRFGMASPVTLRVTSGDGTIEQFEATAMPVGVDMDTAARSGFHLDIPGDWDSAEPRLIQRLYELGSNAGEPRA